MKRNTPEHPKVFDLAEKLKVKRPTAIGYLELLWHFTAVFAPEGDVGRFTDKRIEAALDWTGASGRLVQALISAGWLDEDGSCRLVVHDWQEHADQAVRKRLQRAGKDFVAHAAKVTGRRTVTDGTEQTSEDVDGFPRARLEPEPEPEPEPVLPFFCVDGQSAPPPSDAVDPGTPKPVSAETVRKPVNGAEFLKGIGWEGGWRFIKKAKPEQINAIAALHGWQVDQSEMDLNSLNMIWARLQWFEEFWAEYWRKADKKEARIAYFAAVQSLDLHERVIAAVEAQRPGMVAKEENFRPLAATWLHKERWDDTVESDEEGAWAAHSAKPHFGTRDLGFV